MSWSSSYGLRPYVTNTDLWIVCAKKGEQHGSVLAKSVLLPGKAPEWRPPPSSLPFLKGLADPSLGLIINSELTS